MSNNSRRAFTLIELFVVMAVIIILAGIIAATYTGIQERARVVQDLNNLRQIGLATQMYMNDNDGAIFSTTTAWMNLLHPKYLSAWKIFRSPFDSRSASENDASAPVSYGLNGNNKNGSSIAGLDITKITNSSAFIVFAPAQTSAANIVFSGTPAIASPGVTVYKDATNPGGPATGGTHNQRKRINAVFADWHSENMFWTTFIRDTPQADDPSADHRWDP